METDGRILVAVVEKMVYVKPFGYATQQNSLGLPEFIKNMFREGCRGVAFDLEECDGMDSTFLGVVASAAMTGGGGELPKSVVVLNADRQARHELEMVGLMPVVSIHRERYEPPADLELSEIDFVHLPGNERERVQRIKELHEELIRLNEKNRKKFGSFVEMLEKELDED